VPHRPARAGGTRPGPYRDHRQRTRPPPALPKLQVLKLARTNLTDAGVADLAKLKNLAVLDIRKTGITDKGLVGFRRGLKALREVFAERRR